MIARGSCINTRTAHETQQPDEYGRDLIRRYGKHVAERIASHQAQIANGRKRRTFWHEVAIAIINAD